MQSEQDVESLARCIVAFALKLFNGDEAVRQCALAMVDPGKSKFAELRLAAVRGPVAQVQQSRQAGRSSRARKTPAADELKKEEETEEKMDVEQTGKFSTHQIKILIN